MSISFQNNQRLMVLPKLKNYTKAQWLENLTDLIENYEIQDELGFGSYGIVYKAIEKNTNAIRALKISSKSHTKSAKNYQEVIILSKLNHPNIVHLFNTYETNKRICFILEFCPGSLAKIMEQKEFLEENDARQIIKYLAGAVDYIHQLGIVHRDLKIENILIGTNPENPNDKWFIKLIDFGLSAFRKPSCRVNSPNVFDALCGTIQYMAPELVLQAYSRLCDVWSVGVICYRLITGKFPYHIKKDEFLENIKTVIEAQSIDFEIGCSSKCINLIKKCLTINPAYRLTAGEILIDPWITDKDDNSGSHTNIFQMMDHFAESEINARKSKNENIIKKELLNNLSESNVTENNNIFNCSSCTIKVHSLLSPDNDDDDKPKFQVTSSDTLKLQNNKKRKAEKISDEMPKTIYKKNKYKIKKSS